MFCSHRKRLVDMQVEVWRRSENSRAWREFWAGDAVSTLASLDTFHCALAVHPTRAGSLAHLCWLPYRDHQVILVRSWCSGLLGVGEVMGPRRGL